MKDKIIEKLEELVKKHKNFEAALLQRHEDFVKNTVLRDNSKDNGNALIELAHTINKLESELAALKEGEENPKDVILLTANIYKDETDPIQFVGTINEENNCMAQSDTEEECKKTLLELYWIKKSVEHKEFQQSEQDKTEEIIKSLQGEKIEDMPTFTSTDYPVQLEQSASAEEMLKAKYRDDKWEPTFSCIVSVMEEYASQAQVPTEEVALKMFKDFFTYHNESNRDYKGIEDLFKKWWNNSGFLTNIKSK